MSARDTWLVAMAEGSPLEVWETYQAYCGEHEETTQKTLKAIPHVLKALRLPVVTSPCGGEAERLSTAECLPAS